MLIAKAPCAMLRSASMTMSWGQLLEAARARAVDCSDEAPVPGEVEPIVAMVDVVAALFAGAPGVAFATSGSTGERQRVVKTWESLFAEARMLAARLELREGAHVLSLVPPRHLYGFLFGFLVPALAGAHVTYATWTHGAIAAELPDAIDLLVAVPPAWTLVAELLETHAVARVTSSGAPFDAAREAAFVELRARLTARVDSPRLFDVLGSTETGGLGWREVGLDPERTFTLFPEVRWRGAVDDGAAEICSPYATPARTWMKVGDRFAAADEAGDRLAATRQERIVHLGRSDHVFKLGATRYSLAAVEAALASLLDGAAVRCRFREDAALAKGGELVAFAQCAPRDVASLRAAWLARSALPFPTRVTFVDREVPDAMGKTPLQARES